MGLVDMKILMYQKEEEAARKKYKGLKKILEKKAESKAQKRKLRSTISQIAKNSQKRWLKSKEKLRGKIE